MLDEYLACFVLERYLDVSEIYMTLEALEALQIKVRI